MKKRTKKSIPAKFQPILWSYDFSQIDPERDKKTIIINTINYGGWYHWLWIIKRYGKKEVKRIVRETPITTFRLRALRLATLLLGIKKMKYASRSDYIQAKTNIR